MIAGVRDQPRQIYTSVREPGGLRGLTTTRVRAVAVAGVSMLVLAVIAVAIVSLV